MNKGTGFNGFKDLEVQPHEHVVIRLEDAIKRFQPARYTIYSASHVVDELKKVEPYSTEERMKGLRCVARGEAVSSTETYEGLVGRVRGAEDELREQQLEYERTRQQYSRLKERFYIVKGENHKLRREIEKLQEQIERMECKEHDLDPDCYDDEDW